MRKTRFGTLKELYAQLATIREIERPPSLVTLKRMSASGAFVRCTTMAEAVQLVVDRGSVRGPKPGPTPAVNAAPAAPSGVVVGAAQVKLINDLQSDVIALKSEISQLRKILDDVATQVSMLDWVRKHLMTELARVRDRGDGLVEHRTENPGHAAHSNTAPSELAMGRVSLKLQQILEGIQRIEATKP